MYSFRTAVLPLALGLAVVATGQIQMAQAQTTTSRTSSGSSSSSSQAQSEQSQSGNTSVQARIRERREKRRAAAIHDAYSHLYDAGISVGYQRFILKGLQRVTEYSWDLDFTRFYSDRFGITLDGRGSDGHGFVPPLQQVDNVSHPGITQYTGMIGPTYRFYRTPRISVSGRVLAGFAYGNFSGDFSGDQSASTLEGLYPNGSTYAFNAAVVGEYNISPELAFKIAPEYNPTGFGSSFQSNRGVTVGFVYRFGKQ